MKKRPKISVIIPVYNGEDYLATALDSILSQTFSGYEVLVVNDGSTDRSLAIAERYCADHPDIFRVITQENAGAGAARNTGVANAAGKYILFMDSDDVVEEKMLSDLYRSAQKYQSEIVICPFYRHGLYGEVTIEGTFTFSARRTYSGEDYIRNTEQIITTCTKLYRRDFIKRYSFPSFWFEDVALLPVMMSYAKKITYVPCAYYHYLRHRNSTVSNISSQQILGSVDAVRYIKEHANPELSHVMAPYIAHLLLYMCIRRPAFADQYVNLLIEYRDYIKENTNFKKHHFLYKRLKAYLDEDYEIIPKRIYYDHFGGDPLTPAQEENIRGWQGTLVEFDAEIVCLDENNCDINEHPLVAEAYREGRFEAVGQYFKCKYLAEHGGIALSPDVRGCRYITRLLTRTRAFFAFYDDSRISDKIYASLPGEPAIQDIFNRLPKYLTEEHSMSAALTDLFIRERGVSYSYQWESNFKSKYIKTYDGQVRIYSTNVLTYDYGIGTSIAAIHCEEPAMHHRDGSNYCEVNAFYYHTLQKLVKDYMEYRKNEAREKYCRQNVQLNEKLGRLRKSNAARLEQNKKLERKNRHYLSLINDFKGRKFVWFIYRISMKFFPPKI